MPVLGTGPRANHHGDRQGTEIDKVVGLELGADNYVTKPYSYAARGPDARGAAPSRRSRGGPRGDARGGPGAGGLRRHVVFVRGAPVQLPLKEFELLQVLLRTPAGC